MSAIAAAPPGQRDVEGGGQGIPLADVQVDNDRETGFTSASVKVWKLYESEADKHDIELAETWKGETDAMLIFTGLFSAVVSAFIIETYKTLLPDTGSATVALLTQLVAQSSGSSASSPSAVSASAASTTAIRINILMFLSLFLSLTCALMSTLIQQWTREYLQYSRLSAPPHKRGRVRAYLFQGLTKFQMRRVVESIPVLLHLSVFIFFFAFGEFLHTVNHTVGFAARCCIIVLLSAYSILSVLPLIVASSPYQTALTTPLRPCAIFLRFLVRLPVLLMKGSPPISFRSFIDAALQHNRSRDLLAATERRATTLDHLALQWLLEDVDENSMDELVTGLPALIRSPFLADATATMEALVTDGILERVGDHLTKCMSSQELSQAASMTRAIASLETQDAIFSVLDQWTDNPQHRRATISLIKSADVTRTSQDSALALRAACIRALMFRNLIGSLSTHLPVGESLRVPPRLLPLALRLRTWASGDSRRWRNQADLEEVELRVASEGYNAWSSIAHDGHVINFLVLIRDVLSCAERQTLDLTTVWETLETMVGAFSITQPAASASACSRFQEVHADVREQLYGSSKAGVLEVSNNVSLLPVSSGTDGPDMPAVAGSSSGAALGIQTERSPQVGVKVQERLPVHAIERYTQLLELMDKVAIGLHLVPVLSADPSLGKRSSPTGELRLRHDQVYAKDPFGSFDVLDALSSALPVFVSSNGLDNARDTVEKIISEDGLLRRIDEHLKASVNSEVPQVTRHRMSMASLRVLEEVFTVLEGSPTVRWYEVGVDDILRSANKVAFTSSMVGRPSAIHAYCALGLMNHVVMSQLRARIAQGHSPVVQILEEQLFLIKVYDWLCLGDEQERKRRQARGRGDLNTEMEASSPKYLQSLLLNGPLQNFSIMAFHLVPHLGRKETVPDFVWAVLHKLMGVPGLTNATDSVALKYFGMIRGSAFKSVVEKEGRATEEQLELLKMVNGIAETLGLPEMLMPSLVTPPQAALETPIPPNTSGYAPVYI